MDAATATSDAKPRNLGTSLPVPNVQDLTARPEDLTGRLLQRYVRPRASTEDLVVSDGVPVVDLGRLLEPEFADEEATKLKFACEERGFFQLINHGIPDNVIEEIKRNIEGFFQLPLAEKKAVAQFPGGIEGYGQAFVVSEEQKLDWADMYYLATQPPSYRNLRLWPTQPSTFRSSLECYSTEVQRVANDLLLVMAKNLGVKDTEKITGIAGSQSVRINYYPPCPTAHDKVLGLSPHSDAVGLTLLLQVSSVAGLQIRRNDGWIPVQPLPGALIANIGDVIEIVTNGKYKSIEHRAVVNADEERLSIAAFHSPKFGTTIGPLEEIIKRGKLLYKTKSTEDYVKLVLSSKLDGKNIMDAMKISP